MATIASAENEMAGRRMSPNHLWGFYQSDERHEMISVYSLILYMPLFSDWLYALDKLLVMRETIDIEAQAMTYKFSGDGHDRDRDDEQESARPRVDFWFCLRKFLGSLDGFLRCISRDTESVVITRRIVQIEARADISASFHSKKWL